jgi:cell division septal protein FtsQ
VQKLSIGLLLIMMIACLFGAIINCPIAFQFSSNEAYTPRHQIVEDLASMKTIRWIQLLNWPIVKRDLLNKYPMIFDARIQWQTFPRLGIRIEEKKPWAMIIYGNNQDLISKDGVVLNQNMQDIELPNSNIVVVKSNTQLVNTGRLNQGTLTTLKQIEKGLHPIALFNLQHILIEGDMVKLIESRGTVITLGKGDRVKEKLKKLKYFLGETRQKITQIESIDIQLKKQVIIK